MRKKQIAGCDDGVLDAAALKQKLLPLMREYIDLYSQQQHDDESQSLFADPSAKLATSSPPPAMRTKLAAVPADSTRSSAIPLALHSHAPTTPRLAPIPSARKPDSIPASSKKRNHVVKNAKVKMWTEQYPATGGSMGVAQWAPLLLREVDREVSRDAPKPNSIRVSVAMHVVEAAFNALGIPEEFLNDLYSAMYASHAGLRFHEKTGTERATYTPKQFSAPLPMQFTFEALQDAVVQRDVLMRKTVDALSRFDSLSTDVDILTERDRASVLRQHFVAWKSFSRQSSTWRRATTLQKNGKEAYCWKRVAFYGWRCYMAITRMESELQRLHMSIEDTQVKHATELTTQATSYRKQMDTERRLHDDALSEARANQTTAEERKLQQERLVQLKQLETAHKESKKLITTYELQIKELSVTKEQSTTVLRVTIDRVAQALISVLDDRKLNGLRAADVLNAAMRVEAGMPIPLPDDPARQGIDLISTLTCSASSVLLGWVNLLLKSDVLGDGVSSAIPSLSAVGAELADCSLYCALWAWMEPGCSDPAKIRVVADPVKRVHVFLGSFNVYLQRISARGGIASTTAPSKLQRRSSLGAMRSDRREVLFSPLHIAGITPEAFLLGEPTVHSYILLQMLKVYHSLFLPRVIVAQLPKNSRMARFILDDVCSSDTGNKSASSELHTLDEFTESLQHLCASLHFAQRSQASWRRLVEHVSSDIIGRFSLILATVPWAVQDLDKSVRPATVVPLRDGRSAWFTVRGVSSMIAEAREAATHPPETNTTGDGDIAPAAPAPPPPSSTRITDSETDAMDEDLHAALELNAQLVPNSSRRQELHFVIERFAAMLSDVYCTYSNGVRFMRSPQFSRLCSDCGIPDPRDFQVIAVSSAMDDVNDNLDEGSLSSRSESEGRVEALTRESLFDKYCIVLSGAGGTGSGKALTPIRFSLLLSEFASLLGVRLPHWQQSLTSSSAARQFEAFVFEYFFVRATRPIFLDVAFRARHHLPFGILGSKSLSALSVGHQVFDTMDKSVSDALRVLFDEVPMILKLPSSQTMVSEESCRRKFYVLALDDFVRLWKELEVIEPNCTRFTAADAKQVFTMIAGAKSFVNPADAESGAAASSKNKTGVVATKGGAGVMAKMEMDLGDWLDAVSIVSCFKNSSPFYTFYGRIKSFVSERLVQVSKRKYPTLTTKLS